MTTLRIGHFSDLHGKYHILDRVEETPDLWVSTGDFFPNWEPAYPEEEVAKQSRWFRHKVQSIRARLRGRPVMVVEGNHDFAHLVPLLRRWGVEAYAVGAHPLEFAGWRWGGFREIPFIRGRWNGELDRDLFAPLIEGVFAAADPEILLTHAPAFGTLDAADRAHIGIEALAEFLETGGERGHRVHHHFFGHNHEAGGLDLERDGISYHNSATTARIIELTR